MEDKQIVTQAERQAAYDAFMGDLGVLLDRYAKDGRLTVEMLVNGLVALTVGIVRTLPPFSQLRPSDAAKTRLLAIVRATWEANDPHKKVAWDPNAAPGRG